MMEQAEKIFFKRKDSIMKNKILLAMFMVSCAADDGGSLRYTGYIPHFSLPEFEDALSVSSLLAKEMEESESNLDPISCESQLVKLNDAPQAYFFNGNFSFSCAGDVVCPAGSIGHALSAYAISQFYDCNARQQVQEDGISKSCQLRVGTGGDIGDGLVCDESESTTHKLQYNYTVKGNTEDFTRFTAWTMDPGSSSVIESDLEGQMINKYLQDDGHRTKLRVNLTRSSGAKTIDVTTIFQSTSPFADRNIARVIFKEKLENDVTTEHYISSFIWAANWGSDKNSIIAIRTYTKKSIGSVVFVKICDVGSSEDKLSKACDVESSPSSTKYFNADNEEITSNIPSELSAIAVTDTNFEDFVSVLGGANFSEYFNPDRYSPEGVRSHSR